MVATGSGLAPFRALLQEELAHPLGPQTGLVFGCRTESDILWRSELDDWSATHSRFRLTVTLSRPSGEWAGESGWVQRHVLQVARTIEPAMALLCGLSPMTDAVEKMLVESGFPASAIRVEAFDC
jgi:NAD(P)H-flavin reductase